MRFLLFFISVLTVLLAHSQSEYELQILAHRDSIDAVFSNPEKSILKGQKLEEFESLDYFSPGMAYKVQAKFKRIKKAKTQGFKTSTDRIAKYRPYGIIKFKLHGKRNSLIIYEPAKEIPGYPGHLFLPFNDLTNGIETYGGGRYLDLNKKDIQKKTEIDFNLCYNPYCAYTDGYSCPVPPVENRLNVEIKAGVKLTPDNH